MADTEIKAEIVFADNTTLHVRSTVEQIMNAIEGVTTPQTPVIALVDQQGSEVWLNANQIRAFKTYNPSEPLVTWA